MGGFQEDIYTYLSIDRHSCAYRAGTGRGRGEVASTQQWQQQNARIDGAGGRGISGAMCKLHLNGQDKGWRGSWGVCGGVRKRAGERKVLELMEKFMGVMRWCGEGSE